MNKLDKRGMLLFDMLKNSKKPLTSTELAIAAGVTTRTIKNDLKNIAALLPEYGAALVAKPGTGYCILVTQNSLFGELEALLRLEPRNECRSIPQSKYQRINYVIMKMLTVDYCLSVDDLADEMFVERSTLVSYMKEIRTILKRYKLSVVSDPRQGIIVEGLETHKRLCISEFFFHNYKTDSFYAEDNMMFSNLHSKEEIRKIKEILLRVIKQYNIQMSAFSVENMAIHIVVALRRWMLYDYVRIGDDLEEKVKGSTEEAAGEQLIRELEKEFCILLPHDEAAYVALHLKSKRINAKSDRWNSPAEKEKLTTTLREIFDTIETRFGMHFHDDFTIENYLLLHIRAMLERLEIGFVVRNSQVYTQRREYLMAGRLAQIATHIIEKNYGIPVEESEEGFLILYFNLALYRMKMKHGLNIAVTNGSGRPEGIILLSRITQARKGIPDVITFIDAAELDAVDAGYDIIISTAELPQITSVPVAVIGNSMTFDTERLQRVIDLSRFGRIDYRSIFPEDAMYLAVKGTDRETLLAEIRRLLAPCASITLGDTMDSCIFYEIGEGCAMLFGNRAPEKTILKMFCLKKPVVIKKDPIQLVFWVDAPPCEFTRLNVILDLLSQWLTTERSVTMLKQNLSYIKLVDELEKMQLYF